MLAEFKARQRSEVSDTEVVSRRAPEAATQKYANVALFVDLSSDESWNIELFIQRVIHELFDRLRGRAVDNMIRYLGQGGFFD